MSLDDQQAARRKKYALMMTSRVVCLLAAVPVAGYSIPLALALIAGGVILPWCAVIIANDRPPKKSEHIARYPGSEASARAIAATAIDVDPDAPPADAPDSGATGTGATGTGAPDGSAAGESARDRGPASQPGGSPETPAA